jgi:hypothetical protein
MAFERACEKADSRKRVDSKELDDLLNSPEGMKVASRLMFKKHHGHLSPEAIDKIIDQGIAEQGPDLFRVCFPQEDSTGNGPTVG